MTARITSFILSNHPLPLPSPLLLWLPFSSALPSPALLSPSLLCSPMPKFFVGVINFLASHIRSLRRFFQGFFTVVRPWDWWRITSLFHDRRIIRIVWVSLRAITNSLRYWKRTQFKLNPQTVQAVRKIFFLSLFSLNQSNTLSEAASTIFSVLLNNEKPYLYWWKC